MANLFFLRLFECCWTVSRRNEFWKYVRYRSRHVCLFYLLDTDKWWHRWTMIKQVLQWFTSYLGRRSRFMSPNLGQNQNEQLSSATFASFARSFVGSFVSRHAEHNVSLAENRYLTTMEIIFWFKLKGDKNNYMFREGSEDLVFMCVWECWVVVVFLLCLPGAVERRLRRITFDEKERRNFNVDVCKA